MTSTGATSLADLPAEILHRIAQYTTKQTCSRIASTSKKLNGATSCLLFQQVSIAIGDTTWFEEAFKAVDADSWQHVKKVTLRLTKRLIASSPYAVQWDLFCKYWRIFDQLLPRDSRLEISDEGLRAPSAIKRVLVDEVVRHCRTIITVFRNRHAASLDGFHVLINLSNSDVSERTLALSQNFSNLTLIIAGTSAMSFEGPEDAEDAEDPEDPEAGTFAKVVQADRKAALAVVDDLTNDTARDLHLVRWPPHYTHCLNDSLPLTRLDIEESSDMELSDLRHCLYNFKDTLQHLTACAISLDEASESLDSRPVQMSCLRTLTVFNTDIDVLPKILGMLRSEALQTITFLDCLALDDSELQLYASMRNVKVLVGKPSCAVTFESLQTNHSPITWRQTAAKMVIWHNMLTRLQMHLRLKVVLDDFVHDSTGLPTFPNHAFDPVDNCRLDYLLPVEVWSDIIYLDVSLDCKPYLPSRRQRVALLPRLHVLQIQLKMDQTCSLGKLRYLLCGIDAPALTELKIWFGDPTEPTLAAAHAQLLASELNVFHSLASVMVLHTFPVHHAEPFKCLRERCRNLGIRLVMHTLLRPEA